MQKVRALKKAQIHGANAQVKCKNAIGKPVPHSGSFGTHQFKRHSQYFGCRLWQQRAQYSTVQTSGKVLAVDFSPAMLEGLNHHIATYQCQNIQPILRAWEDDWSDIPPCDLLLSSRSSTVKDFKVVMDKIASHALKRVVITQPVNGYFTDQKLFTRWA